MFDYEAEMITAIRESNDNKLLEIIDNTKSLFSHYYDIRTLLSDGIYDFVIKLFVGISSLLLTLFFFFLHQQIHIIGALFLGLSILGYIFTFILYCIIQINADCWLDFLKEDIIQDINDILESYNLKIINRDEYICKDIPKKRIICLDYENKTCYSTE